MVSSAGGGDGNVSRKASRDVSSTDGIDALMPVDGQPFIACRIGDMAPVTRHTTVTEETADLGWWMREHPGERIELRRGSCWRAHRGHEDPPMPEGYEALRASQEPEAIEAAEKMEKKHKADCRRHLARAMARIPPDEMLGIFDRASGAVMRPQPVARIMVVAPGGAIVCRLTSGTRSGLHIYEPETPTAWWSLVERAWARLRAMGGRS